ncbi:substrate-binding domain-containing protein [Vallitalea okinawensis]|uniref:substrate-binding domain-containing protein n=1 Tax=Vallitalea okinawensis TaxID=2078660 RepID=UPI00130098CB|nr:substrate-binding domain-containing protein [Vallitalea okinawensis]
MKILFRVTLGILLVVLFGTLSVSLYYGNKIKGQTEIPEIRDYNNEKGHYVLIYSEEDSIFWEEFVTGALEACIKEEVDLEISKVSPLDDQESILEKIDMAIASKVDGIILQAEEDIAFETYINKATEKGIPVITVASDCIKSTRQSYIGTNAYETGLKAGELIKEATDEAKIVIITQEDEHESTDISTSNYLSGIYEVINNDENMEIIAEEKSSYADFSAEGIAYKIINNNPEANMIICTSANDTLGVAQVMIEFNRVGSVQIIGYDMSEDMVDYIQKGIVYGAIARNPREMGVKSIETMKKILKKQVVSEFIDTGIIIYTKDNIKNYSDK